MRICSPLPVMSMLISPISPSMDSTAAGSSFERIPVDAAKPNPRAPEACEEQKSRRSPGTGRLRRVCSRGQSFRASVDIRAGCGHDLHVGEVTRSARAPSASRRSSIFGSPPSPAPARRSPSRPRRRHASARRTRHRLRRTQPRDEKCQVWSRRPPQILGTRVPEKVASGRNLSVRRRLRCNNARRVP